MKLTVIIKQLKLIKTTFLKLVLLLFASLFLNCQNEFDVSIFINQIGYLPNSSKHAFVFGDASANEFKLIEKSSNKVVYTGELSGLKEWEHSGTSVRIANFSDFKEQGEFFLEIGKVSKEVKINANLNSDLGIAAIKSYYYARVSEPVLEEFGGEYARSLGHPDTVVKIHKSAASKNKPEGTIIKSPGGWYDAGDYNKYIVNSGVTMHTLLQLYEMFPGYCNNLNLNIPESKNQIPDVLDEIIVNLRWMLTMQDQEDGGVYHKLTSKNFCGMVPPEDDTLERYVVSKTTAATLDFAAVTAKSYRILSKFEQELPGLADSCLVAAKKAWNWSENNPDFIYKQPEDITTGAYGDEKLEDEKYWASNELYLSTQDESYLENIDFDTHYEAPNWPQVGALGNFSWITSDKSKSDKTDMDRLEKVKSSILKSADKYYETYKECAFKTSIDSFAWGSNSDVAYQSELLIHAYKISGSKKYLEAAESNLNYILGANPLDLCFVTGFGEKSAMNIHDRRSASDTIQEPIPGLLVGGPTKQARDDCGEEKYNTNFPAMSYLDEECSYSTNEVAINWNAPLSFLVNAINAIHNQ